MVDFEFKCYHSDSDDNIIGAEITLYDGDDEIDTITIVDKTKLNELSEKLDSLDNTYVDSEELETILANVTEGMAINATTLNGYQSDYFLKRTDTSTYTFKPITHASTSNEYGVGSKTMFGHVKTIDNLTSSNYRDGEALSAYQGRVLNDKLTELDENNTIIQNKEFNSHFDLIKRNGIVTLTINDWDINYWLNGRTGWNPLYTLPDKYKPEPFETTTVKYIYVPNLFGANSRIRINCNTGVVEACQDSTEIHLFYAHASWIAKE